MGYDANEKCEECEMEEKERETSLNPLYTFENFIVGGSNKIVLAVAKDRERKRNAILYLYGEGGLGKTHLLQAMGHQSLHDNKSVIYTASEKFVNEFTQHLRSQTMDRFREKYRECDILLVDDIEFLINMPQAQKEFFHTIEERKFNNIQTIIASDRPPKRLFGFFEKLERQFISGLILMIKPSEPSTVMAIVNTKCEAMEINLDENVVEYIVEMVGSNLHRVDGVLSVLAIYSDAMDQNISLTFAKEILENIFGRVDEDLLDY